MPSALITSILPLYATHTLSIVGVYPYLPGVSRRYQLVALLVRYTPILSVLCHIVFGHHYFQGQVMRTQTYFALAYIVHDMLNVCTKYIEV